jgi:hypothetical protein
MCHYWKDRKTSSSSASLACENLIRDFMYYIYSAEVIVPLSEY